MTNFSKLSDIVNKYKLGDNQSLDFGSKDKYYSAEFQKYGYDLAVELDDLKHKSLYIKLAKTTPRNLLENAKSFVKDATNARSKGRLFMWRLKQLKNKRSLSLHDKKK